MNVYDKNGVSLTTIYNSTGDVLSRCYKSDGTIITLDGGASDDYDKYYTDYQHAVLNARNEWKTQYRADSTVIPIILHTDQHNVLSGDNSFADGLCKYLALAIKWNEVSACVGLGDVDLSDYSKMWDALSRLPSSKQINIWGNHDLWLNYSIVNDQFVVDWDTNYFDNSAYGDTSYAYSKKGIEYHIDEAHNIKYVCIAGWEIDKSKGGDSHYNITRQSMEDVIDMLEMEDGYDIVILTHCTPFHHSSVYNYTESVDTLYDVPVLSSTDGTLTNVVINDVILDNMLSARNSKTSGTINDSYGNEHSYDFTNCTGRIICCMCGHGHRDKFGYSVNGGIPIIMYDAFAYDTHPFYMINIDRTNQKVDGWKITSDAVIQHYTIPFDEQDLEHN